MKSSSNVKIPLRSSATFNLKNDDKYRFIWFMVAKLHPISDPKKKNISQEFQIIDNILMV